MVSTQQTRHLWVASDTTIMHQTERYVYSKSLYIRTISTKKVLLIVEMDFYQTIEFEVNKPDFKRDDLEPSFWHRI